MSPRPPGASGRVRSLSVAAGKTISAHVPSQERSPTLLISANLPPRYALATNERAIGINVGWSWYAGRWRARAAQLL